MNLKKKINSLLFDLYKSQKKEVMNNTFWMGVYPALQKPHLDYMFDKVSEFIKSKK